MLNQTAFHHRWLVSTDMAEQFQVLNQAPFKVIGYNYPEEKIKEMLGKVQV